MSTPNNLQQTTTSPDFKNYKAWDANQVNQWAKLQKRSEDYADKLLQNKITGEDLDTLTLDELTNTSGPYKILGGPAKSLIAAIKELNPEAATTTTDKIFFENLIETFQNNIKILITEFSQEKNQDKSSISFSDISVLQFKKLFSDKILLCDAVPAGQKDEKQEFSWTKHEEQSQMKNVMAWFHQHIKLPPLTKYVDVSKKTLLLEKRTPNNIRLKGTPDIVVCVDKNDLLRSFFIHIEFKKGGKLEAKDIAQVLCQNYTSENKPIGILTNLVNQWIICWFENKDMNLAPCVCFLDSFSQFKNCILKYTQFRCQAKEILYNTKILIDLGIIKSDQKQISLGHIIPNKRPRDDENDKTNKKDSQNENDEDEDENDDNEDQKSNKRYKDSKYQGGNSPSYDVAVLEDLEVFNGHQLNQNDIDECKQFTKYQEVEYLRERLTQILEANPSIFSN